MAENIYLKVSHNFKEATAGVKNFGNAVSHATPQFNGANKNLNKMRGSLRNLTTDANRGANAFSSLGKVLSFGIKTYTIVQAANAVAKLVQMAMDGTEIINLFSVSMGALATETNKSLVQLSELSGLDLTNLQQATGTFTMLARSMGLTNKAAAQIGLNATKMSVDLSSLVNVPIDQVFADVKSGLIGQTETVYKYGADLTEAALKEEALALGIDKSVRSMTQGEKMFLRMSKFMKASSLATGDFAKTIDTCANQIRLLKENLITCGRTLGTLFLPMMTKIVPYIRAVVMVVNELAKTLLTVFGISVDKPTDMANNFADASDAVEDTTDKTKALKKELNSLGFDELNTINQVDTSSAAVSADGTGGGITDEMLSAMGEYDSMLGNVKQKANAIRDKIMEWLGFTKKINDETGATEWKLTNAKGALSKLKDLLQPTTDAFGRLWDALKPFEDFAFQGLIDFYDYFLKPLADYYFSEHLPKLVDILTNFVSNIDWDLLNSKLADFWMVLEPFQENVGNGLLWFYENVLTPIGLWTVNELLPEFLTTLTNCIDILNNIIEGAKPALKWWFENFITPIAEWTGGVIIDVLRDMNDALATFSDWCHNNPQTIADMTNLIIAFFGAWQILNLLSEIGQLMSGKGFAGLLISIGNVTTKMWDNIYSTVALKLMYAGDVLKAIYNLGKKMAGLAVKFLIAHASTILIITAITVMTVAVTALVQNWDKMTNMQKGITVLAAIASAAAAAAIAIGVFHASWSVGLAVAGIAAGIATLTAVYASIKGFKADGNYDASSAMASASSSPRSSRSSTSSAFSKADTSSYGNAGDMFNMDDMQKALSAGMDTSNLSKQMSESASKLSGIEGLQTELGISNDEFKTSFDSFGTTTSGKLDTANTTNQSISTATSDLKSNFDSFVTNNKVQLSDSTISLEKKGTEIVDTSKTNTSTIGTKLSNLYNMISKQLSYIETACKNIKINIINNTFSGASSKKCARGGILENGSLFQAGEYGKAEAVGAYGGKTTVMPLENTDFVSAMYDAVYSAVTSASSNGGSVIENVMYLDGDVVYKNQQQVASSKGIQFAPPAFIR